MQSESVLELAKALVKAQAAMGPAIKDAKNPFLKTSYASLNAVLQACRDALLKNGIAVVQSPVSAPDHLGSGFIGLETKLIHAESGEWMGSTMVIPLSKQDPQGMGAAISYGRRYALSAILGIVSEEDNDCELRSNGNPPELAGVSFKREKDAEGKKYITAVGNTRPHTQALRRMDFSWSERRSVWYKAA